MFYPGDPMPATKSKKSTPRNSTKPRKTSKSALRKKKQQKAALLRALIITLIVALLGLGGGYVVHRQVTAERDVLHLPLENMGAGDVAVHFIDKGQADAVLIQTDDGFMLIDAARNTLANRRDLVGYLRQAGVTELRYVVATHPHADHIGGFPAVLDEFAVAGVTTMIMPNVSHTTAAYRNMISAIERNQVRVQAPISGESFSLGSAEFTILAPNGSGFADLNDYSVAMRMLVGEISFIFAGDATRLSELQMISAGHYLNSTVLMLPHHGSRTSSSAEFLNIVSPTYAVISVGAGNSYGHPHQVVMDRLIQRVDEQNIFRTDQDGHIVFRTDGTTLQIFTSVERPHIDPGA